MMMTSDLIRDTLLCVERLCESFTDSNNHFVFKSNLHWKWIYDDEGMNKKYNIDDIKYCILQLSAEKLINARITRGGGKVISVDVDGLTYTGHDLLNNIRDDSVWEKIKKKIGDAAGFSLSVIAPVAVEIGTAHLKSKMGL